MDDLDLQLLKALRADARRPFLSLSKELKVSDATIHKRIRNLMEDGVIKGFTTVVDPDKLGYKVTAFLELQIRPGSADAVTAKLSKLRNVLEVFELHSHCDILIKVQVKDLHELRSEIVNRIATIPEIISKDTYAVLNVVKETAGPPLGDQVALPD